MFWGLVLEPGKRYTQDVIEDSFHISMACIDPGTTNDGLTSLLVDYEGQEYVLCTLSKKAQMQQVLDLNFAKGDTLSFYTSGKSTVHLSGYLMLDDEMNEDTLGELMEEQEEEEEDSDEEVPTLTSSKRKGAKEQAAKSKKAKLEEEGEEEMSDFFDDSADMEDDDEEEEEEEAEPQPKGKKKQQATVKTPVKNEMKSPSTPAANGESASKKKKNKKEKKAEAAAAAGQQATQPQQQQAKSPAKRVLPGGLVVEDLKEGTGTVANVGKHIAVYYSGKLPKSDKPFDSTSKGQGFRFKLGAGEVIKGWDQGLQGMKVGGKRRITVPAPLGYGKKGSPPVIPPNSTLIFDIELKSVQ